MKEKQKTIISHFIRTICKDKTHIEYQQAERNFLRFFDIAQRIHARIEKEKKEDSCTVR